MVCIFIQTITGEKIKCNGKTVEEIKEKIESQMGIPQEEQTLLYNRKKLITGELTSIEENSNINLIISLEGGAKGKKKKKEVKKTKKNMFIKK